MASNKQHQTQQLKKQILEKKQQLKTLQDKSDLQNKKIKLFRKENEQLKGIIQERNQVDTNTLLQSKEYLGNNSKLEKTINDLKDQLEICKKNSQKVKQSNKSTESKEKNTKDSPKKGNISLFGSPIVTIKEISVTESSLEIDLPNCDLTDEEFLQLQHFSQLKIISVNDNKLTNSSIEAIWKCFPKLQKLNIANNNFTQSQNSFKGINNLQELTNLDVRNNDLGNGFIQQLSSMKALQELSCSKNKLTDECVSPHIQNIISLKYLDMTHNQITDKSVDSLCKLENLTHLYLNSNSITKDGIHKLMISMKSLQFLDVRFNVWDADVKQELRSKKPEGVEVFV